MREIFYSVIVPVFNEEGSVKNLHKEITGVFGKIGKSFEIIFVDDGSTDKTNAFLKDLKPIKTITLRKNYGQSCALDAGIKSAKGNIIVTLDGDGQNDPTDIPILLEKLNEGYDAVCGWRYKRKDPFSKLFISRCASFFRKILVDDGIHDSGCTLRVYKNECFNGLDIYGELHRMIPALLRWKGFKITEVKVNHRPRTHGVTKYDWKRTVKGLLDMLGVWFWRKYESRPLHLFGSLGMALSGFSFLFMMVLAYAKMFHGYRLSDKIWPLVAVTGFITGIQLFIFGILADLIIKSRSSASFYNIKETIEK